MKKIILPIIIILSVFILSGCATTNTNVSPSSNTTSDSAANISNLKDALQSQEALKCTYEYKDASDAYQGTMYLKSNQFKTVMDISGQKINSLFDGEKYYSWIEGQNQGFLMSSSCLKEISNEGVKTDEFDPQQSFFSINDFDSAFSVKCEKSNMDLSIPDDVNFQDMCELLKNLSSAFENMNLDNQDQ